MGAKTTEQIKARPALKCDVCGRKFLNVQALKSHHKFLHTKTEASRRVAFKKQVEAKSLKKKVVPVHMLKRVNPSLASELVKTPKLTAKSPDLAPNPYLILKKPEFECPVCAEKFPVYFTAFRHIQKQHCIDDNGVKVAPNSPLLIKPIRIEVCGTCGKQVRSTEMHTCSKEQSNRDQYLCLGCEQVFNGLVLYQHHVKGMHADDAENYFFSTREEFTSWKEELQEHSSIDFIRLNRPKSKEIYHCSYHAGSVTASTKLCPSAITVREYSKGLHVCYYKEHHGHTVEENSSKKYNEYFISLNAKDTDEIVIDNDEDSELYQQFKKIITCIVFDAAKIDIPTLKELLGKALEMTSILKNYKCVDKDTPLITKCLTDTQIAKTLDGLKSNDGKRKLSPVPKEAKKEVKKVRRSLPPAAVAEKSVENGNSIGNTKPVRRCAILSKSVSFNKNLLKKSEEIPQKSIQKKTEETPLKSSLKKAEDTAVKTSVRKTEETLRKSSSHRTEETPVKSSLKKMEETPQKNSLKKTEVKEQAQKSSVKKKEEPPKKGLHPVTAVVEEKKLEEITSPTPVPRSLLQSPSSFNDSYKNFVDQNFKCQTETSTPKPAPKPVLKPHSKKKEIVKTKIGQFKVKTSVSPKNISPKDSPKEVKVVKDVKSMKDLKEIPVLPKNFKVKPDIRYEVKEQENDVNILILKI